MSLGAGVQVGVVGAAGRRSSLRAWRLVPEEVGLLRGSAKERRCPLRSVTPRQVDSHFTGKGGGKGPQIMQLAQGLAAFKCL